MSLLVFRFLFGVGEAGAYANMARVARAGGLLWLLARWGGAFSPLLFGEMLRVLGSPGFRDLLVAVGLPGQVPAWRMAFWTAGLIGLFWCLAFYPWFRDDPAALSSVNDAELRLRRISASEPSNAKPSPAGPVVLSEPLGDGASLCLREFRLVVLRQLDAALHERSPSSGLGFGAACRCSREEFRA
jgi:MFS family permease